MKLKEILDKTINFFKEKGIETPRLDAELLIAYGLGLERIQLYLKYDQPIVENELVVLRDLVRRRALGEPVAYIVGYKDFYKSRFVVNSNVLVPRPETELIIDEVISWAKDYQTGLGILDLGSGSGCIGLSLLRDLPHAKLLAVDISAPAIEVAKANAEKLGFLERVRFVNRDAVDVENIFSAYREFVGRESVDVIVSNPPYISFDDRSVQESVKKFEPHAALFSEEKGLGFLMTWSKIYAEKLNKPGLMVMEMGMSQGEAMKKHYEGLGHFNKVKVIRDLSGYDRFICGEIDG